MTEKEEDRIINVKLLKGEQGETIIECNAGINPKTGKSRCEELRESLENIKGVRVIDKKKNEKLDL